MFDIGWQELFIVAVIGILVIGPKDLPRAVRAITGWIRKARSMASEFQDGLESIAREADLEDIKNTITDTADDLAGGDLKDVLDPTGEIEGELDMDLDELTKPGKTKNPEGGEEDETASGFEADDEYDRDDFDDFDDFDEDNEDEDDENDGGGGAVTGETAGDAETVETAGDTETVDAETADAGEGGEEETPSDKPAPAKQDG